MSRIKADALTLFLCGDVMTGRGIDQVLPHPGDGLLHEQFLRDAREYVELAEGLSGPIPRPVGFAEVWGAALEELDRIHPEVRIINLETSITTSDPVEPKGINYRMHPANLPVLLAAKVDLCVLANNHVLDYRRAGLLQTLASLERAGLAFVGAGRNALEAARPVRVGRTLVAAFVTESSGAPPWWAATEADPGVNLLPDLRPETARRIGESLAEERRPGEVVVVSIHWGGNWGYEVPEAHVRFAHALVDAGVDVVHGHSSHHPRPIEVYRDRLILYGCGDFLNDYEGITGFERFRGDLVLMYFPSFDARTGRLLRLQMVPLRIHRMRLERASSADAQWLQATLDGVSDPFGAWVDLAGDGSLELRWRRRN